jgi:DNA adenine methylase
MNGPIKYYGGKRYMADTILSNAPPHTIYIEPYFGGGAVLFAKPAQGIEVVNDINGGLTNFWSVLASEETFPTFQRAVNLTPCCEEFFRGARTLLRSQPRGTLDISHAVAFFVVARLSFSGTMSSMVVPGCRPRGGMAESVSAWLSAVDSLPAVHARLSRVFIYNRNALDVIERYAGNADVWVYLDPPYMTETRVTGGIYAHEMTDRDHAALLFLITHPGIKCKITLSGYRSPLYDSALSTWRRIDTTIDSKAGNTSVKPTRLESLWCNYEQ